MAGDLPLDPVTFEVLKNSFIAAVDQMAEQILRTCYSFVIYNRDFSSALHDAKGECAAQAFGRQISRGISDNLEETRVFEKRLKVREEASPVAQSGT